MQVLFAPLRAFLFCFESIFGNGSRIKSCPTLLLTTNVGYRMKKSCLTPFAFSLPFSRLTWPSLNLIALFVFSGSAHAIAFDIGPYFPLKEGHYWNYSGWIHTGPTASLPYIGLGANSRKSGVRTVIQIPGRTYNALPTTLVDSKASWDSVRDHAYMTNADDGINLHFFEQQPNGGITCTPFTPRLNYFPATVEDGGTYFSNATYSCSGGGPSYSVRWAMSMKVIGTEFVSVPAGPFIALKIEQLVTYTYSIDGSLTQTDHNTIWLARGVGVVKTEGRVENNLGQVANYHSQELASTGLIEDNPLKDDDCNDGCSIGNPINFSSGNKFQSELDYMGAGEFPLQFLRTYNSRASTLTDIGNHWRHNYSAYMQFIIGATPNTTIMYRAGGKAYTFRQNGAVWSSDADVNDQLSVTTDVTGTVTGARYTTANRDVETYDSTGRLLSIKNQSGLLHALSYEPTGLQRLVNITDSSGRRINFSYDSKNRIMRITDPASNSMAYGYDSSGRLTSVTRQDSSIRKYNYNEPLYTGGANLPQALTSVVDENNAVYAIWNYDSTGRAVSAEHAGGVEKVTIAYNVDGTRNITDSLNQLRVFSPTKILGVSKNTSISALCRDCTDGGIASKTYDLNGNVATRTDFNGNQTIYGYDLTRNLETSRVEAYATPLARTINTAWHPNFRLPTLITEPGRVTAMSYDAVSGNLLSRKITSTSDAKVRQWTYTYTTAADGTLPNLLKTIDGPRTDVSDITSYTYYPNGDLLSVSNALNQVSQIVSYDPHGRPLTLLDPNGLTTTLTYWPRGWLKSRSVGPETTFYDYDGVGQIKKVTLPSGAFIRYDYDDAHRLTDIWDQDNNRIRYTLDKMGNRIQEDTYDALGATVATKNRTFDALSRLFQEIDAVNSSTGIRPTTTYGYDANGNSTWVQPPNQPATNHQYDALNRLFKTTDALLGITQYGYDNLDQLTSVKDPRNLTTSYNINALGDQTTLTSPDTGLTNKTYDAAGNLSTSMDARNQRTAYLYDAINRVTGMSYSSGAPVSFTYDQGINGKGRLTGMSDESGATQWTYDAQGRVLTKTATTGALTQVLRYRYDAQGRLDQITYPSGKIVALGYLANKISSINADNQPVLSGVQYHPFSGPKLWTFGNNSPVIRNYDQSNRLFAYNLGNATRSLSFDDTGRISNIADSINPGLTQNMGYDNLDRLTSWVTGTGNQSFTYDPNGNRTNLTLGATNYSSPVSLTANRLTSVSGPTAKTYSYDNAGNIQTDSRNTFSYNARGRLQSVTNNSGTETYQINGLGQRVVKSGLINVRFVYDEGGKLIGEYTPSGVLIQETVYLGDLPVAVLR